MGLSRELEFDPRRPVHQGVVDECLEECHQRLSSVSDRLQSVLTRASEHPAPVDSAQPENVHNIGGQAARHPLGDAQVLA